MARSGPIVLAAAIAGIASPASGGDASPTSSPAVTRLDDQGLRITSADGAYVMRINALMQADGRFFLDNQDYAASDTFLIRRFRPTLEGTLFGMVDFRLTPDLAGGNLQVMDAYVDIHPRSWARVRIGKFKGAIGLERLQSAEDLPPLERGLDQNLSAIREIGVELWGRVAGGLLAYSIGAVNGAPDDTNPNTDSNRAKDVQGRLFVQPFKIERLRRFGSLGIGVAASTGNRKGTLPTSTQAAVTGLGDYKTPGQMTFFSYYAPPADTTGAETTFAHERASHLDPQLYYYRGPFGLLAEWVWSRQGVQRGNNTTVLTNQATHATVSFVVGGTESFEGPTPNHPFDPPNRAFGALELSARYTWLEVDPATFGTPGVPGRTAYADPAKSASAASSYAVTAAWVPRRSFHLGLMFAQTWFDGGAGTTSAVTDRATENLLLGRAQVNF